MFWLELALAGAITFFLTLGFGAIVRRTRLRARTSVLGLSIAAFGAATFAAVWLCGAWLEPLGPPLWGVSWLSFLFAGLVITLVMAIVAVPPRPRAGGADVVAKLDAIRVMVAILLASMAAIALLGAVIAYLA